MEVEDVPSVGFHVREGRGCEGVGEEEGFFGFFNEVQTGLG